MFFDTIGATNKLPIIGNEFLEFKMRTIDGANGDEEINATNHRFQVYEKKIGKDFSKCSSNRLVLYIN